MKHRQCMRCKKKWDPISFRFDPTGIRPMRDRKNRPKFDKVLKRERDVFDKSVSKLPRWPRWARILTSAVVIAIIVTIIVLLRR